MAFINEYVPENAKSTYNFKGFMGPFGPCKPEDLELYKWTIDRERNAFLLYAGGGGGRIKESRGASGTGFGGMVRWLTSQGTTSSLKAPKVSR